MGNSPSSGALVLEQVHKFGGTCVSAAERIASAAQLVLKNAESGDSQVTAAPHGSPPAANCCRRARSRIPNARMGALWRWSRHLFQVRAPDNESGPLTLRRGLTMGQSP